MAITAITSSMCIKPLALQTKNPNAQPITSMTAMMYNKLLMIYDFNGYFFFGFDSIISDLIVSFNPKDSTTFLASSRLVDTPEACPYMVTIFQV